MGRVRRVEKGGRLAADATDPCRVDDEDPNKFCPSMGSALPFHASEKS